MFPYWLLFSVFAFGAINHRWDPALAYKGSILLTAAGLFTALMIGLRFEVGGDWPNYIDIFNYAAYTKFSAVIIESDPGYLAVNWLAHQLGVGIWFVNLVCGLIFTWGLIRFAERQPNPWLAVVVAIPYLIIVVAMGYARQGVALGLLMGALAAFDRGAFLRFIIYTMIAAIFHKSAIIILPLVAFAAVRNKVVVYGTALGIGFVLFTFLLEAFVSRLLVSYVETKLDSEGTTIRVFMNVLPAILFLTFQRRISISEQERKLWRNFSLAALATAIALALVPSSTIVDRIALYLIPLQIFVLARLPFAFADRGQPNGQLTLAVIVYSALIQFVWLTQATHADAWLPYRLTPILQY